MSSWHTDQLKYAFGIGGFMSFYGVVGLIVMMLPAETASYNTKIVVIALVLLTMPFALITGYVATRRSRKKAEKELAAANETAETPVAPVQNLNAPVFDSGDLDKSAEEVVQFLKSSNLGTGGKDAVYSLPWYIIAGTPRAGKSSLVMGSNLNFQTLPSQRQSEQKFVRPTGNVDWRVTSDAVFVDTAGRYQTEGVDGDEWNGLLETIKKYRPNRPLDGFLLVVNTERILKADEREVEEIAKTMRTRLDEAMSRLKVRFPVYLVFSNADSIEGFRDSFSTSKNEGKTLVWGATIPLEKSENAQTLFDGEYEILQNSIMKRRLMRLSAPFPPVRQLRIFNFPLHFGSARRKIGSFVNALFRPNPFAENPFLRGFYFTAAPAGKSAQTVGTTYFTERLFRDVVLRDKDLVSTFLAQRQRAPIFGWFVTILSALLVTALLGLAGFSLYKNKQILDQAKEQGEKVLTIVKSDAGKNPLAKNEQEARREINATEDLRELMVKLDDYERNNPPFYMRFGMYSGDRVYKENLLPIYMSVVEQRFKIPTVRRVEAELRKFAASAPVANPAQLTEAEEQNLGKHYDLLKAYLMLTGEFKGKAEASHLSNTLKDYWTAEAKLPPDLNLTAQQQLDFWAKQVNRDDADFRFPRISPDGKLIADARKKLQAFPPKYRYLARKVSEISKQVDDKVGPTTTEAILTRNGADTSFLEGNYAIPSAYTKEGFVLMKTAIAEANEKLSEDDWVMGEEGKNTLAQSTDAADIEARYFRDYADNWRNFIKNINVKPYKSKEDATNALQAFSSANSPMKILLNEVAKNTNLSAKPVAAGWWDWIKSFFPGQGKSSTDTGGGTQVEKEFRPLFTFIGTKEQAENAPIEKYTNEIGKVSNRFTGISTDQLKSIAQELANDKDDTLKLRNSETAITNLIKGFNETPSAQEVATLLQEPLSNLKGLLGADAKSQLSKAWTEQILPAAKEIEKGFPFEDGQTEADLTKLTAFLNPTDGKLSKFYDERLKKYFEESNGQLKVKDTSEIKFSDEFVTYLNNAFNLRKALFGTNPTPKFEYEFRLNAVKDALIEVTIDGTKIVSEGTASSKLSFPAGTSVETGVFMNFASTSGTTSTSGTATAPASSANTSAPPAANTSKFLQNSNSSSSNTSDSLKFPGNWGLFRFVDAGSPQKQPSGEYLLSYSLGGKKVTAIVKPSGGDLFDKTIFRQMKAPQNFLK
ncbi:MAG: type VI secretion system membrane subunit TssM [Pyrinomonadaceae bacterium]|nr:type VI secretion system membrane subunit TssM [Pyrinomonadaceae bacterium]